MRVRRSRKGTGILGDFEDPDENEICLWEYLKGN